MTVPTIVLVSTLLVLVMIYKVPSAPVSCTCPAVSSMGYCPHLTDCQRYIQCDGVTEYTRDCPSGTVWYQNLVACAYGSQSNNCTNSPIGFTCPDGNNTFHADPSDCTGFIQCWDTIPFHMACPTSTIWYQQNETCIAGTC